MSETEEWEDWEAEDFAVPVLNVHNEEQLKRLEERKLVEEADNKLTNDLFSNKEDCLLHEYEEDSNKNTSKPVQASRAEKKTPNKKFESKKLENEQKQKEISRKNKEEKIRKAKAAELYGEAEDDDEYSKYEDMFY